MPLEPTRHSSQPYLTLSVVCGILWSLFSGSVFAQCDPQEVFKLLPDDGILENRFGCSVAISGQTCIVGSRWDNENGIDSGSA